MKRNLASLAIALCLSILCLPLDAAAGQRMLSRQECADDIDSLVYTLAEVHPDLYSRVGISELMGYAEDAKANLGDSLSVTDFYERIAPLVAMIGDAHTAMGPPGEEILERSPLMLPLLAQVGDDGALTVSSSAVIPAGSRLLSINDVPTADMVEWMLRYISGEQEAYRLTRLNDYFPWLFQMRYGADRYAVEYQDSQTGKTCKVTLDGIPFDDFTALAEADSPSCGAPYEYAIPEGADYAVMTFASCEGAAEMAAFADAMVADLRGRGIRKLIIDIRDNTGGNSAVGDTLLRRLSPVPFVQYDEVYCRVTPQLERLIGESIGPQLFYYKVSAADYEQPLPADRRFDGQCVLLTSRKTFSSASSFARAFSHFGIGTIVGEDTGGLDIHFGDIIPYTLPHSGLTTLISFKRFRLPGATSTPSPTHPDHPTPAPQALDAAVKMMGGHSFRSKGKDTLY